MDNIKKIAKDKIVVQNMTQTIRLKSQKRRLGSKNVSR